MSDRDGTAAEETGQGLFVSLAVAQVFSPALVRRKRLVNKHLRAECDKKVQIKIKNVASAAVSAPFLSSSGRRAAPEDITVSCRLVAASCCWVHL